MGSENTSVCMEAPTCGHHMHTYGKDKVQQVRVPLLLLLASSISLATWHVTVPPARAYVPRTRTQTGKLSISARSSYDD
jgi:hypothetical protein